MDGSLWSSSDLWFWKTYPKEPLKIISNGTETKDTTQKYEEMRPTRACTEQNMIILQILIDMNHHLWCLRTNKISLNVTFSLSFIFTLILTDFDHHRLCTWNQHNQETFQWHKISFEWGNTKEEIQHHQEFFLQHSSKGSNSLEPSWFLLQNPVQDTRIYLWSKDISRLLRFYKCLIGL